MAKKFHIVTMGCQMNEYDSDLLAQSLINDGFLPVKEPGDADLILINTCSVRAKPEQKALSLLGRMIDIKKRKPGLILGLVGCVAQQGGSGLIERFPELDLVMGPREVGRVRDCLAEIEERGKKVVAINLDESPPIPEPCRGYFTGRFTGYISIMEGCDNFCSYCIVPFVRGREVSKPPRSIIAEAELLVSEGVRDITLLGQNVNSYMWKGEGGEVWDFPMLLREVGRIKELWRLRFTTSHPKDLSKDLISCFDQIEALCPHIHLPFQAGSNSVLRRMRRGYTRERYLELISSLREVRPDIAISSDVMVGFPGETEYDFEMTLDLIKKVEFDALFSFKYSDRRGTLAEKMQPKVEEKEKSRRLATLQSIQRSITLQKNRNLEGKKVMVLVEGVSRRGSQYTGRTDTNKIVNFTCKYNPIGGLIKVKIKDGLLNSLRGECLMAE